MTVNEHTNCCKVTVEWYPTTGKSEHATVYLPSRLLWSAKGMAELFKLARLGLAHPCEYPNENDVLECWESFHIIAIKELDGFVLDAEFEESEGSEECKQ